VFTTGGSFSETQQTLAAQSSKAIFTLEKCIRNFVGITPLHKCSLFDKLVVPILCYCCEVWCFRHAAAINRVHMGFCRRLLGVKQTTQNNFVYGELGRTPLVLIRHASIVKYWLHIVQETCGIDLSTAIRRLCKNAT
jgi:hypothetical protein